MPSQRLSTIYAVACVAALAILLYLQIDQACLSIPLVIGAAAFGINAYVKWDRDETNKRLAPPAETPLPSGFGIAAPNSRQLRVPNPHPDDRGS
jgi:hypothetical protein